MGNLTRTVFAEGVGLMAARWRDVDPRVAAVMAEWLAARGCTAEEFVAGVKRAVAEDEFPPSARRILELGRPEAPAESRAGAMLARVLELRTYDPRYGTRLSLERVRLELGAAVAETVVAIGGPQRLNEVRDDAFPFVLRDFAKHYAAFIAEEQSRVAAGRFIAGPSTFAPGRRIATGPTPIGSTVRAIAGPDPLTHPDE